MRGGSFLNMATAKRVRHLGGLALRTRVAGVVRRGGFGFGGVVRDGGGGGGGGGLRGGLRGAVLDEG